MICFWSLRNKASYHHFCQCYLLVRAVGSGATGAARAAPLFFRQFELWTHAFWWVSNLRQATIEIQLIMMHVEWPCAHLMKWGVTRACSWWLKSKAQKKFPALGAVKHIQKKFTEDIHRLSEPLHLCKHSYGPASAFVNKMRRHFAILPLIKMKWWVGKDEGRMKGFQNVLRWYIN